MNVILGAVIIGLSFFVFFTYYILQGNLFNIKGKTKKLPIIIFLITFSFGVFVFLH